MNEGGKKLRRIFRIPCRLWILLRTIHPSWHSQPHPSSCRISCDWHYLFIWEGTACCLIVPHIIFAAFTARVLTFCYPSSANRFPYSYLQAPLWVFRLLSQQLPSYCLHHRARPWLLFFHGSRSRFVAWDLWHSGQTFFASCQTLSDFYRNGFWAHFICICWLKYRSFASLLSFFQASYEVPCFQIELFPDDI